MYRREHWLWALLWIALGVIGAYGVRRFVQGGKDRMKARRALAETRPRLAAIQAEAREPAQVAAAMVLGAEIEQRGREIRWQGDGAALVKTAERMVARVYLLGEVVAAARTVAQLDGDAQVEPRKVLDAALAVVRIDPGADKAGDIDAERRKVAVLDIDDAWRAKLRAALAELRRSVDALESAASSPEVRKRSKVELRPALTQAEDALAQNRLDNSAAKVEELRPKFLAIAVDGLRARIEDVPLGTTKADWGPVVSAVTTQLDVASGGGDWPARRDAYITAQREYFRGAIAALIAHATDRAADSQTPASAPARLDRIASDVGAELAAGDAGIARAAQIYPVRAAEVEVAAHPRGGVTKVAAGDVVPAAPIATPVAAPAPPLAAELLAVAKAGRGPVSAFL